MTTGARGNAYALLPNNRRTAMRSTALIVAESFDRDLALK